MTARENQPGPDRHAWAGAPTWLLAAAPIVLLGLVVWGIVALRPVERLRGEGFPPIEELSIVRTVLPQPGLIELHVLNAGPDPVTIAQVMVDEAYWSHWMDAGRGSTNDPALDDLQPEKRAGEVQRRRTIPHLGRARVWLDYAWVDGEALEVVLISRNGATFATQIEVAVQSPTPDAGQFGLFALLGILVGVMPVSLGLLWHPLVQRLGAKLVTVVLCFTIGLLAFLAVDALAEALEAARELPHVYKGLALIALGLVGAILALFCAERWFVGAAGGSGGGDGRGGGEATPTGLRLAYLIAGGIGLHNLSEGLAIGSAFNLGAVSLGATLIIGFTVHNLTEGLAIVSPLARVRTELVHFLWLGLLAGAPTVLGGWLGAFAYSRVWAVLFLALGAGAIAQVAWTVLRQMTADAGWRDLLSPVGNVSGLAGGYLAMYATGLFVAL